MKMNIPLLRRIQRQILKEPKQFQMISWFWVPAFEKLPNCGTAACIGGWAIALSKKKTPSQAFKWVSPKPDWELDLARKPLRLNDDQSKRLFLFELWPPKFKRYASNNAKQAVARIDHFIKTKGAE